MRIVQLNPFYFPYAGGIERRIRAVSQRLAKGGHDVHVLTAQLPGTPAGESREDGFHVHRLPSRFPLRRFYNPPPVLTRGIDGLLDALRPDIVDYHFRWSPSWNRAFRSLRGPARVVSYQNSFGEGTGWLTGLSRWNDHRFMPTVRAAHRVVVISRFLERQLLQRGVPPDRIRLIPNAVEPTHLARVRGPARNAPAAPYAVGVGRMVPLKGYDLLLDAWQNVPEPFDLVLVGEGPQRRRLQRRAQARGVAHRVHFPGWIEEDEKVRLLRGALAFLHPARFEAFGLSVLEALTLGVPVLAADVGGLPEVVGPGGLILPRHPAAWAQALDRLRRDEVHRHSLARHAKAQARRFDWDRISQDLLHAYQEATHA